MAAQEGRGGGGNSQNRQLKTQCHSRFKREPSFLRVDLSWFPAFAGMTTLRLIGLVLTLILIYVMEILPHPGGGGFREAVLAVDGGRVV